MTELTGQPNEIYATLAGPVNEAMIQKLFQGITVAMNNRIQRIHLVIQSSGGFVGDGIAAYNFISNLPIEIVAYNIGAVHSIAVVSFLGAQKRKASKTATFMIHRTHFSSPIPASSAQLQAIADSLTVDDIRTEQILHKHISMPDEKWEIHKQADLFITADEALKYGIIDQIADFAPPLGATIFNVMG